MSLNLKIGKLGSAIDSATTGHFLSKGATDGIFQAVSSGLDSATITNLIDSDYIQLRRPAETIMTVTGDGANYYFVGDGFPSTSSGDPTLYLTRGKTYRFEDISGSHPFEIRQSSGGSAYSTGVTNNGGSGTVIFTVPMDAPTSLVYQCTVHSGMVGDIVILDNTTGGGGLDSASVTNLIDSAYIQARQTSGGSGGLDSSATISLINNNTNSGFFRYKYSATAGQTAFQDSDLNGNVMSFDPNSTLVFYNGVLLNDSDDYTASSNTVTLTSGADAGSQVSVVKYGVGYIAPSIEWGGDRALVGGGYLDGSSTNAIDYYDITTPGNASDFGDLTTTRDDTEATGNTTYSLFAGPSNVIDYVTAATIGNATDFGDLLAAGNNFAPASDGTYGYFCGGYRSNNNYQGIDYVTIASPGNASDYGDLTVSRGPGGGMGNTSTIVVAGGYDNDVSPYKNNIIDYFTAGTPGNASDFGDLTAATAGNSAANDATYGVIFLNNAKTAIDYITIATPGNATDFGDAVTEGYSTRTCGNATRACHNGNNRSSALGFNDTIQYVTFTTPGNATDFGDLVGERRQSGAASGSPS